MANSETALVTGGSGYIGGWCVARLLNDGYRVHTTVRSLAREAEVRRALASVAPAAAGEQLTFFAADLESDAGWTEAAAGCRYVLHVASPLGLDAPRDAQVLIRPARDGTLRALRAAVAAGAERVVMTSSVAAIGAGGAPGVYDETRWSNLDGKGVTAYDQSKTIAEKAAWHFVDKSSGATTLATVNPVVVLGPVMSADFSGSVTVVSRLLKRELPGLPNLGLSIVDVRDVADLHMRAMLSPQAAGQRFIASAGFLWMPDLAAMLRRDLGAAGARVPTLRLPDWVVRFVANFDRPLNNITQLLSQRYEFEASKAKRLLGWEPISVERSVRDTAESLIAKGLV